jgi:hypothetical protein
VLEALAEQTKREYYEDEAARATAAREAEAARWEPRPIPPGASRPVAALYRNLRRLRQPEAPSASSPDGDAEPDRSADWSRAADKLDAATASVSDPKSRTYADMQGPTAPLESVREQGKPDPVGDDTKLAQGIFLDPLLLDEPPILERPTVPYPEDPAAPPGDGWEYRGRPGKRGNWYNPRTKESLRPDLQHPPGIRPHWDYKAPSGRWYRWFPDGSFEIASEEAEDLS